MKARQEEMIEIVKAGMREVLQEITLKEQYEDVLSLSGSQSKKQKTKSQSNHIASKATEALEKNGAIKTKNIQIRRLLEEALVAGVESFAATMSSSHTSLTATCVQPRQMVEQKQPLSQTLIFLNQAHVCSKILEIKQRGVWINSIGSDATDSYLKNKSQE